MSGKRKITLTVDEDDYAKFAERAKAEGFGRPSILVRHFAVSAINEDANSEGGKTVKVYLNNYNEIAGYAREKKFSEVAIFAAYAMEYYMNKNKLTEAQRQRIEHIYEK